MLLAAITAALYVRYSRSTLKLIHIIISSRAMIT